jgi:hypothetical protein
VHRRIKTATFLELFLDAVLLLVFIAQAFIIGCVTTLGHVPLPAEWANQKLNQRLPDVLSIRAENFYLTLDAQIEVENITLRSEGFKTPLFEGESAFIRIVPGSLIRLQPEVASVVIAQGRLNLPAVYSPSGMDQQILDRIALKLIPESDTLKIDSFAALHEDIRLRGSLAWRPVEQPKEESLGDLSAQIHRFLGIASNAIRQKSRIKGLRQPTVFFQINPGSDDSVEINGAVSSRLLELPQVKATNVSLETDFSIGTDQLISRSSVMFHADQIDLPNFQISARSATALTNKEDWDELLAGQLPDLEIAAEALRIERLELESPRLKLRPRAYPRVSFDGSASDTGGAVRFSGEVDAEAFSGKIDAAGNIHLLPLAPSSIRSKLPALGFETPPYYDLSVDFAEGFALRSAELHAEVNDLSVEGIRFDHLRASAYFEDRLLRIPNVYLRRDWQWLDVGFQLDLDSQDYKVSLFGFAKPYDYNDILPRWWGPIFKDFDFEEADDGLGDFIIYGNTRKRAADLFFGHARASNISYKGVHVNEGTLFVRGRGPYAEIHALDAVSGDGWVRGDIRFASRLDHVRGPMSVRLDLDTLLPLSDAQKLFDGDVAKVIADFETEALPRTTLTGAIFNDAYPEFAGKSFVDLSANCRSPIKFRDIPLEHLKFNLFGRNDITYLRNIRIGYAGGDGTADADVMTSGDGPVTTRFRFGLKGADQSSAIANIRALKGEPSETSDKELEADPGTLGIMLHAQGPVDDPFRFTGVGRLRIENERLSSIQLFGPLSRQLQNTGFGFTSFALDTLEADFRLAEDTAHITELEVDGPRTNVRARGRMNLIDQVLDMRVSVYLFGNTGDPDSNLRKFGDFITKPIPNLLEFELTGTADAQKWRSLYDPRKLIPQL